MERFDTTPPQYGPGMVTFYRPEQVRNMADWNGVADREEADAMLNAMHVQAHKSSTRTMVSQLMPIELDWLSIPSATGPTVPATSSRGI